MAMPAQPLLIGADLGKETIVLCCGPDQPLQSLPNQPQAIAQWLATLPPGPVALALEATSTYHLELLEQAHRKGCTVYLLDGYRLSRYRDSVGARAKTDPCDARLVQRYLAHERHSLRPWSPPPKGYERLMGLLHRRAALVRARLALQQSLAGLPELKTSSRALLRHFDQLERLFQKRLGQHLHQFGWAGELRRCQAIEGIGPLSAAALTTVFHRAPFANSDAFVAFLGLDVRVRDSGRWRGRRKLTKKGDPELRRLLYLAAMRASRSDSWKATYQRYRHRGLAPTQAFVALARKLARVAFAILKHQTEYRPRASQQPCTTT